jgi:hypothetical protein
MKHFDILKLFNLLDNDSYCLIKKSTIFPEYEEGSDFDIFCYDAVSLSEKIISFFNEHISKTLSVVVSKNDYKVVVDIMENNSIHIRFDLYRKLPVFKELSIKEGFFSSVIENKQEIEINEQIIFVPSIIDDAIIRYIEFHEWFAKRPDKIKHVDIIVKYIREKKIDELALIEKIHYYLKLPNNIDEKGKVTKKDIFLRPINNVLNSLVLVKNSIKDRGFGNTIILMVKKIKKNF